MAIEEAIKLMKNEKACILKADTCDRNCAKCELVRKTEDLLSVYDMVIKILEQTKWIPCSERMPKEHEWIGTKRFGTTISDEVYVTFENPEGKRFVKHIRFQNGKLSGFDQSKIDAFYKGSVPIAWMPLPKPYKEDLRDICNERIEIECTHGTCKDCFYYNIDEDGHGYHCEKYGHTRFPVYADFYCKDFEKRGGENELN